MKWTTRNTCKGFIILIGLIASLAFIGCSSSDDGGSSSGAAVSEEVLTILYGKIVDSETGLGVAGARVSIKVNGEWISTNTLPSDGGGVLDKVGDFVFNNVPVPGSGVMPMVIDSGSSGVKYITKYLSLGNDPINTLPTNSTYVNDGNLGEISLIRGVTATIYVVDAETGNMIQRANEAPISIYDIDHVNTRTAYGVAVQKASKDSTTDRYSLAIPATGVTTLYVPSFEGEVVASSDTTSDSSADSTADEASATVARFATNPSTTVSAYEKSVGELVKYVPMNRIGNDASLSVVTNNLKVAGDTTADSRVTISKNQIIKLYFNMPVSLDKTNGGITFSLYTADDLRSFASGEYVVNTIIPVTAELDMEGTRLTITPGSNLSENSSYTLTGTLRSNRVTGETLLDEVYQISSVNGAEVDSMYVDYTGTDGIGSATPKVIVDNFNYCSNGVRVAASNNDASTDQPLDWNSQIGVCTSGGRTMAPFLVFPELVWGTYTVTGYTHGTINDTYPSPMNTRTFTGQTKFTTQNNEDTQDGLGYFGSMGDVTDDTASDFETTNSQVTTRLGSTYDGIGYRSRIRWNDIDTDMSDDTATTRNIIKVMIDAYDAMGNSYRVHSDSGFVIK